MDIREKLERVDKILFSIDESDPAKAFKNAHQEIKPLVREAKLASKAIEYGFWSIGFISAFTALLGSSDIVEIFAKASGAHAIARRNVGCFAGSYSVITEQMVFDQRLQHKIIKYPFKTKHFDQYYNDFIKKDKKTPI